MAKNNHKKKTPWDKGLKKVGDVYHYRFMANGEVHHGSTKCASRTAAEKWLKIHKDEVELNGVGVRSVPTLEALLEKWQESVSSIRSAKDVAIDVRQIRKHFHHLLNKKVNRLSHEDVQGVINTYMKTHGCTLAPNGTAIVRPHTAGGVKSLMCRLDAVMNYGIKTSVLRKIPYWVQMPQVQPKPRPILSEDDFLKFLKVVDRSRNAHVRLAIRLMVGLGLREGEALAAKWDWFFLNHGVYVGQGKSKQAQAIPIPDWLLTILIDLSMNNPQGLLMPSGLLDKQGNPLPHSPGFTRKTVRRAGKAVGVPRLSPHGLRASFATIHHNVAGSSLAQTQQLMNHSQGSTTLKHYIQRVNTTLKAQQNKAAQAMGLAQSSSGDKDMIEYYI